MHNPTANDAFQLARCIQTVTFESLWREQAAAYYADLSEDREPDVMEFIDFVLKQSEVSNILFLKLLTTSSPNFSHHIILSHTRRTTRFEMR